MSDQGGPSFEEQGSLIENARPHILGIPLSLDVEDRLHPHPCFLLSQPLPALYGPPGSTEVGNPKPTLLDCSRSSVAASDKVINGQLQDFIHQEVYGEQPLFPIKNKLPRNRILIISYSTASRVAVEVTRNKKLFSVNVNKKLEEADSPSLRLTWSKKATSAAVLSSLNLIRNVFDCDRENSSKLLSKEERVGCQEKKLRAVLISALPVVDLEPILGQYGPRLKVDQIKDVGY